MPVRRPQLVSRYRWVCRYKTRGVAPLRRVEAVGHPSCVANHLTREAGRDVLQTRLGRSRPPTDQTSQIDVYLTANANTVICFGREQRGMFEHVGIGEINFIGQR
jgi:hypothetical protein